jgi:3-hydroxyacyl-CoA dehydrogenase
VVATDPAPNAEQNLRKFVDAAWPALTQKGLAETASRKRLSFSQDMRKAVSDADFVQEMVRNDPISRSSSSPT